MDFLYAIILGLIEGITEYLPISSTAHLLIASEFMVFLNKDTFLSAINVRQTFDIVVQVGPVLALIVYFRKELLEMILTLRTNKATQKFVLNLVIAFIPAGFVGFLLNGKLPEIPLLIAIALIVGGVVFILVEARHPKATVMELNSITPTQALIIGLAQILALIPGVSRSGATIVAGLLIGIERKVITTFTFYLAIPTLVIASGYSLFKHRDQFSGGNLGLLAVGTVVAFISAYAAIAWFLRYVSRNNFRPFGVYRIVVGVLILIILLALPQVLAVSGT